MTSRPGLLLPGVVLHRVVLPGLAIAEVLAPDWVPIDAPAAGRRPSLRCDGLRHARALSKPCDAGFAGQRSRINQCVRWMREGSAETPGPRGQAPMPLPGLAPRPPVPPGARPPDPLVRVWDHHSEFAVGLDWSVLSEGVIASCAWDETVAVWHTSGAP